MGLRSVLILVVAVVSALIAPIARGLQIQDIAFLDGEGGGEIWGLGLVTGLRGSGDRADSIPRARQIAELLERAGNPAPDIQEILQADNMAMVLVQVRIPPGGANRGDTLDVRVQTWYNATSLRGGQLFITPLQGPLPGQGVFAYASGSIEIEDEGHQTAGIIRGGATVTYEIENSVISRDGSITLNIHPQYAGWPTARLLANTINQHRQGFFDSSAKLAVAVDANSVRVTIPEPELADPASFLGDVLSVQVSSSLLSLPARVIVNEKRGSIVVTGNVEISPAVIAHGDLVVTTITPEPPPNPALPDVRQRNVVAVDSTGDQRAAANLADLLNVMEQLDVPVRDQIALLAKLHKVGHLHAEFIIDD
ncbi:MAG: flagellar basal body P-ring protein FlgI [Planctomycetota bacterium]